MAQILVTGGCGFVGSNLVEELVKKGHAVRVLDNLSRGRLEYLQDFLDSGQVEFIQGDVTDESMVRECMKDVGYVFHEASDNINKSIAQPRDSVGVNIIGGLNVFEAAADHHVKKLIFASSASVYGEPKRLPMKEDDPLDPKTPYCISKYAAEKFLRFYAQQKKLPFIALRYFNVYGQKQHTDAYYTSVLILFIKRLLNDEAPVIQGSGEQSMDFVHVQDVVQANIRAMESEVVNEVFNVGSGTSTALKDVVSMLIEVCGKQIKPIFQPRDVLVTKRMADISKIKTLLKFEPTVNLRDGLRALIEDIKKNPGLY